MCPLTDTQAAELLALVKRELPGVPVQLRTESADEGTTHVLEIQQQGFPEDRRRQLSRALFKYCYTRDWPSSYVLDAVAPQTREFAPPAVHVVRTQLKARFVLAQMHAAYAPRFTPIVCEFWQPPVPAVTSRDLGSFISRLVRGFGKRSPVASQEFAWMGSTDLITTSVTPVKAICSTAPGGEGAFPWVFSYVEHVSLRSRERDLARSLSRAA